MTIDEMLDKVAQNLNISSESVPAPLPESPKNQDNTCADNSKCRCTKSGGKCSCAKKDLSAKPPIMYRTHKQLDLTVAKLIAEGVEKAALKIGVKIVAAIYNEGANLILLHAMDDSYIASIQASQDKAYTAVALKMPTHIALEESRGGSLDGYTNGNGILMLGGGYPFEKNGIIFGGIGISGGTKEQDTLLAQIGAELFRAFTG